MDGLWFYQVFGEEFGPVCLSELGDLLDTGTLSLSDSVRPANSVQTVTVQQALQQNRSDDAKPETVTDDGDPSTDLNIDDFVIESSEDTEVRFFVSLNGTAIGPLTSEDFCRLADSGRISPADSVRRSGEENWQPASEFPEVMAAQIVSQTSSPAGPKAKNTRRRSVQRVDAGSRSGVRKTVGTAGAGSTVATANAPGRRAGASRKKKRRRVKGPATWTALVDHEAVQEVVGA